ncbi:MAG: TadE family protein [Rhodospirillales bacterium]
MIPANKKARLGDRRAIAAIETALMVPLFCLILVALVDLSGVVLLRLRLEMALAAAANYALINASQVNSVNGASLATAAAQMMSTNVSGPLASGTVVVNNGPTATVSHGQVVSSGSPAPADACYCPTGSSSPWNWGGSVACGQPCGSGASAGKFVTLINTQTYSPVFSTYKLIPTTRSRPPRSFKRSDTDLHND